MLDSVALQRRVLFWRLAFGGFAQSSLMVASPTSTGTMLPSAVSEGVTFRPGSPIMLSIALGTVV